MGNRSPTAMRAPGSSFAGANPGSVREFASSREEERAGRADARENFRPYPDLSVALATSDYGVDTRETRLARHYHACQEST